MKNEFIKQYEDKQMIGKMKGWMNEWEDEFRDAG